ncbi:MAG TPA: hypothetical protein PKN13_04500 [Accumulibacter sp.]|nr:hypothetical protein [Accumulibacter sp.]HMW16578.1 hypothetical protein [Accumulibacter sp.]HMX22741.1 hypothetical protein [Accumulibacter sp.]HNC17491.1 hypothetical protein [Accumulibacter sp.]HND79163.1 hypothetical protein [Accumulibacter sp.]
MTDELNALESRVAEVVALCSRLRTENDTLREQLVAAHADTQQLTERMTAACARLELLIQQIPEAKN